ncbi:MAG: FMN-binding negative transcriptional regulator [Pseudomonadota bacterium]
MYVPEAFAETRHEILIETIEDIQFGMLITATDDDIHVSHVPFAVSESGGAITLETHLARANPHWKAIPSGRQTMAVFQGPQAYVRPGFYPSKSEHGKVVPTWAYIVVHARGEAVLMQTAEDLRRHLHALTDANEQARAEPWSVNDAPAPFVDSLQRGIVGVRLSVSVIEGKWKINQNKTEADRDGTAKGLAEAGPEGAMLAAALTARTR